jgi:hypothetical protein
MFKALVMLRANRHLLPENFKLDWEKLAVEGISRKTIESMQQEAATYGLQAVEPAAGAGAAGMAAAEEGGGGYSS